jgi:hypothetical protein
MQLLTANLTGQTRSETLNGREYLVAPLSMIVPGVLNGSKGPLFYPLDEIAKNSDAWNGMPIVVNHPTEDGNPCSARSPKILQEFGVGTIYNVDTSKGKLTAEGWFDVLKTKQLVPDTFMKLIKNEPEELSTGLFTDNEPVKNKDEAIFNGKRYTHIARNYRPDHLAILPDKKGACSVEDGCGVNINEQGGSDNDCDTWGDGDAAGQSLNEDVIDKHMDFDSVDNRASFHDIRQSVSQALRERFGLEIGLVDLFPEKVVFHRDDKLVQLQYTIDEETYETTLSDSSPEEVRRTTEYKVIENESCGPDCECEACTTSWWALLSNAKTLPSKKLDMSPEKACKILDDGEVNGEPLTKDQRGLFGSICSTKNEEAIMPLTEDQKNQILVDLIANTGVEGPKVWNEEDREGLSALPEDKLIAMNDQRELLANASDFLKKKKDEDEEDKEKMAKNQEPVINEKPKTAQEWLAEAPPEIRSAVNNAMDFERRQKDELIKRVTKNERNPFSKEWLNSKSLEELQGLATLASNQEEQSQPIQVLAPHYAGVPGVQNLGEDFAGEDQDMAPEPFEW